MAENGLVPVGSILPYAGDKIVDALHWHLCDGSPLNKTQFADLFAVLGTQWGGDGADLFFLPDLRGRFIRGVDKGAGRDPDASGRSVPQPTVPAQGNHGDAVGSMQTDLLQSHAHAGAVSPADHSHTSRVPFGSPGGSEAGGNQGLTAENTSVQHLDVVISPTGGSETRPINANVNFIIRVA
jgi:microcystin-dependent protein